MNVCANSAEGACYGHESLLKNDVTFKTAKTSGSEVYTSSQQNLFRNCRTGLGCLGF